MTFALNFSTGERLVGIEVLGASRMLETPEARHAVERERPPRDPMSMAEARAFVMRLVEEWAASK
jgi:hypothetical protein